MSEKTIERNRRKNQLLSELRTLAPDGLGSRESRLRKYGTFATWSQRFAAMVWDIGEKLYNEGPEFFYWLRRERDGRDYPTSRFESLTFARPLLVVRPVEELAP